MFQIHIYYISFIQPQFCLSFILNLQNNLQMIGVSKENLLGNSITMRHKSKSHNN